ncbi:uncharacterized protein TRUGW13939_04761 [Talaromyces rugulosus]|uniref:Mannan endo-1,6-alpha-mannosidase n=1 Tax=Talaromyces rugulosus TaxID=121627 RepID=A0A7H8QY12_TALRU|nr:uncharacterized protein TRUGW13939_04761 [Talaromyces rugulosus]QKX57643.1 hypothetical protein TRUGW13939_04761 [Talaromyces rugulosus]
MVPTRRALLATGLLLVAETSAQLDNSEQAFDTLQEWYDTGTGLWDTAGWWNGANSFTVVAELAQAAQSQNDSSVLQSATEIFTNTWTVAPSANPNTDDSVKTNYDSSDPAVWGGGSYDDNGWWALAWIAAYDVTNNNTYLELAQGIFDGLTTDAWGTSCGNAGVYWNSDHQYVNAITNELFLSIAAHLANRVPSNSSYYVDWAQKEWNWFATSGMINSNNTINDGLTDSCTNNGQTTWSYNQGVVLGGLVELNKASPNQSYIDSANTIAQAAISALTDSNNVIHDSCEPDCAPDATQFKGIFIRNLLMLQQASPNDQYTTVIQSCADSIWANDRDDSTNQLSVNWAGPFVSPANSSTHSSAMDALVAAISL